MQPTNDLYKYSLVNYIDQRWSKHPISHKHSDPYQAGQPVEWEIVGVRACNALHTQGMTATEIRPDTGRESDDEIGAGYSRGAGDDTRTRSPTIKCNRICLGDSWQRALYNRPDAICRR